MSGERYILPSIAFRVVMVLYYQIHIQVLFPTTTQNNFNAPTCFGYAL
jgi:hypothetical protein